MNLRPSRATVLIGLGLAALLTVVVLAVPRVSRLLTRTVADDEPAAEEARPAREDEGAARAERTINVKLFFQAADRPGLVMEERTVPFSSDLGVQLKAVVAEIIQGSKSGLVATLPPETKVLEVFVSARGVAYVDLSKEASQGTAGSHDELLSVYSIVNSLTVNFPAVRRVQILLEDRPTDTLAGHVDLSRPLTADMTLLTTAPIAPAAPEGSPAPVPASPGPAVAPRS
ncbi:MAG TPA: GerMN domain-containing protein [Vicinamibacteria bacterium]|nr:GerMN domain-containing protein [Vicinamibacteria bacterium]